jgi:ABC-type multidrug transport system fused ATPase/permease subunit
MLLSRRDHEESEFHVEFRDVCFAYDGQPELLKNISFGIRHGETLGIIGETGSGKSTIIQLLMRFYDPQAGAVTLGGSDIRLFRRRDLRTLFGIRHAPMRLHLRSSHTKDSRPR